MKRFIKEYANYQKEAISKNELMGVDIKEEALDRIERTVKMSGRGLITVDEAMRAIANMA